jgi:hypothetical protein
VLLTDRGFDETKNSRKILPWNPIFLAEQAGARKTTSSSSAALIRRATPGREAESVWLLLNGGGSRGDRLSPRR